MAEARRSSSGRRVHPEPSATDRYWTATLVKAAPPAAGDDDGPTGASRSTDRG
jgi:hypothetical protein